MARARAATLLGISLAGVLATSVAAVSTVLYWYDGNGNGRVDTWLMDDTGDGRADRLVVDGNENNYAEAIVYYGASGLPSWIYMDAAEDGWYESTTQPVYWSNGALRGRTVWTDMDGNDRWENGYFDGNLDGIYEWVCVDTNYDGLADTWRGNAAPAGRGAVDEMARRVAANNAITILQNAGISVFFPTVSVPLP